MITFKHDDGGAAAAGFKESRDCAVRALAIAMGKPYAEVHAALKQLGRKNRRGINGAQWRAAKRMFSLESREEFACRHLGTALPEIQTGRYLCWVSGHFFAVVDGVVHDTWEQKSGRKIKMLYAIPGRVDCAAPVNGGLQAE